MPDDDQNDPLRNVPLELIVSIGRTRTRVKDLLALAPDQVFRLDRALSDPVEIFVGDKRIAYGELTEIDHEGTISLAVRITDLVDQDRAA
ncbi:MAG: FliM/FliN family flagellar motor switch protein [Deltaproteobacteria bacterium]